MKKREKHILVHWLKDMAKKYEKERWKPDTASWDQRFYHGVAETLASVANQIKRDKHLTM